MTFLERWTRTCQERLADVDADATALFPSRNPLYLSDFGKEPTERHLLLSVPREGALAFLVPDLYETQIHTKSWVADVQTQSDGSDPRDALTDIAPDLGLAGGRVLADDTMWVRLLRDLRAALPGADFDLASEVVMPLRARKNDAELDALRRAGTTVDHAVGRVRDMGADAINTIENELAVEIEYLLTDEDGEGVPFGPLVGSGPSGAMPHHNHNDRVIESGDPVVLDFGTVVNHYPGDQTQAVVFVDEPPTEFAEVHDVVWATRVVAVETVEPGVTAGDIDHATREIIEKTSYNDRFIRRTGHGVGLGVYEEPYIVTGSDRELKVGNIFSVKLGVYLPDKFGVQIEGLVTITDDDAELPDDTNHGWCC